MATPVVQGNRTPLTAPAAGGQVYNAPTYTTPTAPTQTVPVTQTVPADQHTDYMNMLSRGTGSLRTQTGTNQPADLYQPAPTFTPPPAPEPITFELPPPPAPISYTPPPPPAPPPAPPTLEVPITQTVPAPVRPPLPDSPEYGTYVPTEHETPLLEPGEYGTYDPLTLDAPTLAEGMDPSQWQWEPVRGEGGKSQYDIAREQAMAAAERDRQVRQEALRRRLAAQGITGAAAERMIQQQDLETERIRGQALGQISASEMAAAEASREAALQRDLQERLATLDAELATMGMNQQERIAALNAELTREGYGLQERITNLDSALKTMGYNLQERLAALNAELTREGYEQADREMELRAILQREAFENEAFLTQLRIDSQRDLAILESLLTEGRMNLASMLEQDAETRRILMDAAYNRGRAGIPLSDEDRARMSTAEIAAYENGVAGSAYEEYATMRDARIDFIKAQLTSLDPLAPNFDLRMRQIYQAAGLNVPGAPASPTQPGGTTPPPGGAPPVGTTPTAPAPQTPMEQALVPNPTQDTSIRDPNYQDTITGEWTPNSVLQNQFAEQQGLPQGTVMNALTTANTAVPSPLPQVPLNQTRDVATSTSSVKSLGLSGKLEVQINPAVHITNPAPGYPLSFTDDFANWAETNAGRIVQINGQQYQIDADYPIRQALTSRNEYKNADYTDRARGDGIYMDVLWVRNLSTGQYEALTFGTQAVEYAEGPIERFTGVKSSGNYTSLSPIRDPNNQDNDTNVLLPWQLIYSSRPV